MPRNSSGTYTLPSGNPVVSGSVIASTWANNTMSDISTALTGSLSRSGQGGMSAQFQIIDGVVGTPSIAFATEVNGGLYRAGAGDFRFSISATDVLRLRGSDLSFGNTINNPTYTFLGSGAITFGSGAVTFGAGTITFGSGAGTVGGAWTFTKGSSSPPSFGQTLSVSAPSNGIATTFFGPSTGAAGFNIDFYDVTNAALRGFIGFGTSTITGAAITDFGIAPGASGSVTIGTANGAAIGTRFGPNGNVTINPPSSGTAFTVNGVNSNAMAVFNANNVNGGVVTYQANGSDTSYWGSANRVFAAGVNDVGLTSLGNNSLQLGTNSLARISISGSGNVLVNAPSSGIGVQINGIAASANSMLDLIAGASGAALMRMQDGQAGTRVWQIEVGNPAVGNFRIRDATAGVDRLTIGNTGGVVIGAPTGGDKGTGTANAVGLYVNGTALNAANSIIYAIKSATTSRVSTTSLSNDPDLQIAIPSTGTWLIELMSEIWGTGASTQGFKMALFFSGTTSATSMAVGTIGSNTGLTATGGSGTTLPVDGATVATVGTIGNLTGPNGGLNIYASGIMIVTATGTFVMTWAQNASSASATNVGIGWIRATKLA